jgi:ABC-type multidrug transport system fused ATPase/permease subunit
VDTKPNSWREFRRIVSVLPGRALLALTVTLLLIQVCVEMALNQALRGVVDAATTGLWPELAPLGLRLAALVALEVLIQWSKVRAVGAYAENGVAFLRDRVTTHLLNLSVPEIESRHSGDYVSRLTNDLNQVRTFLYISLRELIYQPVVAVWSFIFLLTISWQLTLAACAVLPLLLLATSAVSRPMAKNGKRLQESLARVNEISQDAIGGLEVSRVFAMADSLRTRYAGAVDETVRVNKSLARSRSLMYAFSHLLGFVPFTLCIGFGGYLAISGRMTAGGLAVFVNLMNNLTWPLSGLPRVLGEARAQLAASSRLLDILDTTPERSGGTSAAPAASASAIELQHLVFTYPGQGEPVLNDLSLEVRAGEMAALVGPSGSGKSTVMKVLLGSPFT